MRFFTVLAMCLTVVSCKTAHKSKNYGEIDYTQGDQQLIESMVARGSVLGQKHWVTFAIDCKTESVVQAIVSKANNLGFEDESVFYSEQQNVWSSTLGKSMNLTIEEITRHRAMIMPLVPANDCLPVSIGASTLFH